MQVVEEVGHDGQFPGGGHLVVDVPADGEVEHAQPERREHHRPVVVRCRYPAEHQIRQGAVQEVPAAGALLGEVYGGVGLQAVLHVVDDVGGAEDDLRRQVA